MAVTQHKDLSTGEIHQAYDATYATITALEAASPASGDVGKIWKVTESDSPTFWIINSTSNPKFYIVGTEVYSVATTSDATATTAIAFTLNDEETYLFEVVAMGQVGGDASNQVVIGKRFSYYRTSAGNATSLGSSDLYKYDSGGSWNSSTDLTASVSTSTVNFQVTGIAATTIDWKVSVKVKKCF